MCEPQTVDDALVMLKRALSYLAGADATALSRDEQARSLLALERAEARHTAARARMIAAFAACGGYEDDGHGTARTWLRWRTRITRGAAAGAVGWARRLAGHPVIASAMEAGDLSVSWAREICGWTDRLPQAHWEDADAILTGRPAAARIWPTWPRWPRRCTSVSTRTIRGLTGTRTPAGRCGSESRWAERDGWKAT